MKNARTLAVDALVQTERSGAYSNLAINEVLADCGLDKRERSLASALFFGVLERKMTLDYYIGSLLTRKGGRIHCFTRQVLRCAIYQMLYMDKIPNSAAVNEAVKMMKASKRHSETSFVNAILRKAAQGLPPLPDDATYKYSAPQWLVDSLYNDYGKQDADKFLENSLLTPPLYIRVNTIKTNADELIDLLGQKGINAQKTAIDNALLLTGYNGAENEDYYKKGYYYFQDLASQICVAKIGLKPKESFVDLCAAPGGKSFTAAQYLKNDGKILSCDLHEHRVELIKKSANRLGITCIECRQMDAVYTQNIGVFDAVLCDVPCSGLGVIARKPDIKYKDPKDFSEIEKTQKQILNTAAAYVKKGGRLVYSTCTLRKAENENMVDCFLREHNDFEIAVPPKTFFPHIDGTDGFFVAVLCKKRGE